MLTISGKTVGRKKPLFADWSVPPPPDLGDGGSLTLRDLLGHVVRSEVAAFQKRQKDRLSLRVLSEKEIEKGAEKGKIEMGGSEVAPQKVDPEEAVAVALEAFEDGLYLVIVDEEEKKDLDGQVFIQPDSKIAFVRLAMLAGG
jgi:hypothetical protein